MRNTVQMLVIVAMLLCAVACSDTDETHVSTELKEVLTVYKTPNCGCCNDWVTHVKERGFEVELVTQDSVAHVKDYYKIPEHVRSCHTAVSESGFVFEGHVPAKFIREVISANKLNVKGLIVPAMPLGSPGMEFENQFNPYEVYSFAGDGELFTYISVNDCQQQF